MKEPFGLVVVEAARAGVPVLLADRPGLVEAARAAGARHLTFPAGDEAALRAALGRPVEAYRTERPVESTADLADIDRAPLVAEGGLTRDDLAPLEMGEIRCEIFGDPVREIGLIRISAQIDERENRDAQGMIRSVGRHCLGTRENETRLAPSEPARADRDDQDSTKPRRREPAQQRARAACSRIPPRGRTRVI